jgi:hypothetical protein
MAGRSVKIHPFRPGDDRKTVIGFEVIVEPNHRPVATTRLPNSECIASARLGSSIPKQSKIARGVPAIGHDPSKEIRGGKKLT